MQKSFYGRIHSVDDIVHSIKPCFSLNKKGDCNCRSPMNGSLSVGISHLIALFIGVLRLHCEGHLGCLEGTVHGNFGYPDYDENEREGRK